MSASMHGGTTRTVSAVLQSGTYALYCPILDHREGRADDLHGAKVMRVFDLRIDERTPLQQLVPALAALAAKAGQGVAVRVIHDRLGARHVAAPETSGDSGFDADTTRTGRDVPAPGTHAPTATDGTGSRP